MLNANQIKALGFDEPEEVHAVGQLTLAIYQDPYPEAPDLGVKIYYLKGSRYCLGTDAATVEEIEKAVKQAAATLPVWAYVHGGATIHAGQSSPFSCQFDSGQSGWAVLTKETKREWFGERARPRRKKLEELLANEVNLFDSYLRGAVYGFRVFTQDGDELESCWGFYGSPKESGVLDEGRLAAKAHWQPDLFEDLLPA